MPAIRQLHRTDAWRRPSHPHISAPTLILLYCLGSSLALFRQLDGKSAFNTALKQLLLTSSQNSSKVLLEAKFFGEELLRAVTSTRMGTFLLINAIISSMFATSILTKTLFLGPQLSVIETGNLADRMLRFTLLKVVFLGAIVHPDTANVALYCLWAFATGFMKAFIGLAKDRGEALLSSPTATLWQHARCAALLLCMLCNDAAWIAAGLHLANTSTAFSWALLWLFDAVCVAIEGFHAGIRYVVQGLDQWKASKCISAAATDGNPVADFCTDSEADAEARSQFLYLLDLAADLALHALNLAHYAHILKIRGGLRFQLIDIALLTDVRFLIAAAWRRGQGHVQYRKLTHKLRYCFADAKPEELAQPGGVTCAICMETMRSSAKVLPCGHLYHLGCLREWLQQGMGASFSCPLCRANLMVDDSNLPIGGIVGRSAVLGRRRITARNGGAQRARQPADGSAGHFPGDHMWNNGTSDSESDSATEMSTDDDFWMLYANEFDEEVDWNGRFAYSLHRRGGAESRAAPIAQAPRVAARTSSNSAESGGTSPPSTLAMLFSRETRRRRARNSSGQERRVTRSMGLSHPLEL